MARPLSSGCWSMCGRTVKFTSSRPWVAERFNASLLAFILPYFLPAWRWPHWWLAVRCEPLACLGELGFDWAQSGGNRYGISLSHATQAREASEIKQPLCVYDASRRRWWHGWLWYGPGLQRWALGGPASGLFISMPDTQEGAFLPGPPNELHAHRQMCARKTAGHSEGREA